MDTASVTTLSAAEESSSKFDLSVLWDKLLELGTNVGGKLVGAILILIFGSIIIRFIMRLLRKSKALQKSEATVTHFLINFTKVVLDTLLIISVIAILGVPMSSVIAAIASAGVAIGLALQGALSNLAGGIMILIFKPFKIGDFVSTSGYDGTVQDIGIFYTILTTVDNREVTIPNGTVMGGSIVNVSAFPTRRMDLEFSVAYGTDVSKVETIILDEANAHALSMKDPAPFCRLSAQASSALVITLRVWCKSSDYWQLHFDLMKSVYNRLVAEGIQIPFDQLDVHIKGND